MGCLRLNYDYPKKLVQWEVKSGKKVVQVCISVDPLSDKYPSHSPFNYCLNNPLKYIDPNGMEVEYASFSDRLITGLARIFNPQFRKDFKTLKKSEETYVFNHNAEGKNNFTTDGDKLFINYSMTSDFKKEGATIFSNMRHESEHAMQFEHGEIGFSNIGVGWTILNFDIHDEIKARDVEYSGSSFRSGILNHKWGEARDKGGVDAVNAKIEILQGASSYKNLPLVPMDNSNKQRIKSPMFYMLPKKER